jgi:hypothetical protein
MSAQRQLITLQFGAAANWAGAHFWNLQARRGGGRCGDARRLDARILIDAHRHPHLSTQDELLGVEAGGGALTLGPTAAADAAAFAFDALWYETQATVRCEWRVRREGTAAARACHHLSPFLFPAFHALRAACAHL